MFVLGPGSDVETLPIASFVVEGVPHALVAARMNSEFAIGVRHGCFCAHPYLIRLLGLQPDELARFRAAARRHDHSALPGAVRASAGISTTTSDLERLLEAIKVVANSPPPVEYVVDPATGNSLPQGLARPAGAIGAATGCARG